VKSVAGSDLFEDRYFNQLRMLVQLRNLEAQFNEAMETITKFFKEERDPLYRRGELKGEIKGEIKGREQQKIETVLNLKKSGFEIGVIANVMGLTADEVEKITE
jgi:predicted transposase/invertase (TIGR01784 family)